MKNKNFIDKEDYTRVINCIIMPKAEKPKPKKIPIDKTRKESSDK